MRNGFPDVAVANEVIIAGIPFPTTGPIRLANVTVVPNPIILGDTTRQTETQVVSQLVQPDASSGLGVNRANARIEFDRAWTSEAETRFRRQITLPNLVTDLDRPAGETAAPLFILNYLGTVYGIFGTKIYTLVGTTWTLEYTLPAVATAAVVFEERLWVTTLANGCHFKENPNALGGGLFVPGSWNVVAENSASLMYAQGEQLFRWLHVYVTSGSNQGVYFWENHAYTFPWVPDVATVGSPSTPSPWSIQVHSGLFIDVIAIIPMVQLGGNLAGTFYVATDGVYWNTSLGLTRLAVNYGPLQAGRFGRSACQYKTDIVIPTGEMGLMAYRPGTTDTRLIGLDREDGVPAARWGVIEQVAAGNDYLYALVTQRGINDSVARDLAVYAYDGHWHSVASTASGLLTTPGTSVQGKVMTVLPDGLYVGYVKADGNPRVVRIDERTRPVTPKQVGTDPSQTRFNFAEGPVTHVTPWYDFGSELQSKLMLKLQVQCEATPTETITVQYATDLDDSRWTSLGTITASGLHALSFNGPRGVSVHTLQLKYVLQRAAGGANDYKRPLIDGVTVEFMRLLPATYGFAIELDLTKGYKGRSAVDLLDAIKRLSDPVRTTELVDFTYQDDQHQEPITHWVRISRMTGQEYAGRAQRGVASFMVSMMAPYSSDAI